MQHFTIFINCVKCIISLVQDFRELDIIFLQISYSCVNFQKKLTLLVPNDIQHPIGLQNRCMSKYAIQQQFLMNMSMTFQGKTISRTFQVFPGSDQTRRVNKFFSRCIRMKLRNIIQGDHSICHPKSSQKVYHFAAFGRN